MSPAITSARVDARGPLKRTALMAAAMNGNELIAQMLLDAGADIDLTDAHGTTALMESARASAAEVLDVFAARNPALDVVDARGRTNMSAIGDLKKPKVKLPGVAGASTLRRWTKRPVLVVQKQSKRNLVQTVSVVSTEEESPAP